MWPSFGVSLQSRHDQVVHTYLSDNWFIGPSFVDKRRSATPTLRWTHFWSILWGVSWYRAKRGGLGRAFMSLYRCLIVSKKSERKSSDWSDFISCYKQAPPFLFFSRCILSHISHGWVPRAQFSETQGASPLSLSRLFQTNLATF